MFFIRNSFVTYLHSLNGSVKKLGSRRLAMPLLIIGICCVTYYFWNAAPPLAPTPLPSLETPAPTDAPSPSPPPTPSPEPSPMLFPTDKLFIADTRRDYESGSMRLSVPRLALDVPVLGATDDVTLNRGIGLYEYAQLPDRGNPNVSIAGHRDIHGKEFYYIDTITQGDLLYLTYQGKRYTYEYKDTVIVQADDWGPIYSKDFSALTLTSCDPIGTSRNRIIVTARLIDVQPVEQDSTP